MQFFMKATQLDQMKDDYSYIMKTKTMTQNTVEKHKEVRAIVYHYTCMFASLCNCLGMMNRVALETMCDWISRLGAV